MGRGLCLRAAAVCLLLSACGSSLPPVPTAVVVGWPVGTALTVVSGADGRAVAGASVVLGGRRLTADGSGVVTLDALAADFSSMDVVATGFLDRQTVVRSSEGTRIALWPAESDTGLNPQTTAELVYTAAARCCPAQMPGRDALHHVAPSIRSMTLVLAPEYRAYPGTVAAVQEGSALAAAACGGRVTFALGDATTGARIGIGAGVYPDDTPVVAFADRNFDTAGYITGGEIAFVDTSYLTEGRPHVDLVHVVAHELGHMLGLEHSTAPGVMQVVDGVGLGFRYSRSFGDYSPTEKLVLQLVYGRRALNRFPDNDRASSATSVRGDRIVCRR